LCKFAAPEYRRLLAGATSVALNQGEFMSQTRSEILRLAFLILTAGLATGVAGCSAASGDASDDSASLDDVARVSQELGGQLPNNFPFLDGAGTAATFSNAGFVDLESAFHTPQGTNGRSCASCHLVQAGWSVRPIDVELKFLLSQGTDPIFNLLDANSPTADVSTPSARYASYSMVRRGLFRRGGAVPPAAEYEIIAVDDPLGAGGSLTRFEAFRRPLATANFHIAKNVGWHDQNTNGSGDVHAGLVAQAVGNVTGAQQGAPASTETINAIVSYEEGLRFAQQSVFGVGLLTACGAHGGPENLSGQAPVAGRFDLYDAWLGLAPGACTNPPTDRRRAQVARGQKLFNATNANGGSCGGCHNAANNGSNADGTLFDIGASRASFRKPGMPLYTVRNKLTRETRETTDPGRALRTGRWADMDRFKTPSLRGVSARPPYFHNGIAATLTDVVVHYEVALGFVFTPDEEADLVAFLQAL
jgi:cytochrome c peroxidase